MNTVEITIERARDLLPKRPEDGHKGTFGHVFIVGGTRGFTGAVKLATGAALRSGAGLVTAGVPRALGDLVGAGLTEAMTFMLPSTIEETIARNALSPALEFAANKNAVALGPGISQHPETRDFVLAFTRRCPVPLLVDADGLNCLSTDVGVLKRREAPAVLTPHPGEMARLTGKEVEEIQAAREETAHAFAKSYGCVLVLKGRRTVVASPDGQVAINTTGNEGMASGGTGDVLSGLIAGLLAQGVPAFEAAQLGVFTHGLAGDVAAHFMPTRAMIASDLIEALSEAWALLEGRESDSGHEH